ncbi:MAG: hypothetical protein RIQ38_2464 [Pseudomonadota bacterium]|jgi:hypothetical protein
MSMNLNIVPPRAGLQWAREGIRTFWKQPLAMSGLFFLFLATVSLISMMPLVGSLLALASLPALNTGLLAATRIAQGGRFPMPSVLYLAFRSGPARRAMFQLGLLYAVGFLLLMGASMLIDGGQFASAYLGHSPINVDLVESSSFQAALWISMLLYAPLAMLFWHAPALVQWQGVSAAKSLFFSAVACWRNIGAFMVYVSIWAALFAAAAVLAILITTLMGQPALLMAVLMPLALLVAAMFFTSMLFSIEACFQVSASERAD